MEGLKGRGDSGFFFLKKGRKFVFFFSIKKLVVLFKEKQCFFLKKKLRMGILDL